MTHDRCLPDNAPVCVLHLIGQLIRGGCELQLAGLIRHLDRDRVRSVVGVFWPGVEPGIRRTLSEARCEIEDLRKGSRFDASFIARLIQLIRRVRPDVVHAWLMSAGLWGRIAAVLAGNPPVIVSYRSRGVHSWPGGKYLDRALARNTPLCIANSNRVKTIWLERLGWDPSRIEVIPNGVDCRAFAPGQKDEAARRRLGCPPGRFLVTMVGTMKPEKNWPMFAEVARSVMTRRPDVFFLGVGGGVLLEKMGLRATEKGLCPDHLRFLGSRTDVERILSVSDAAISTSDMEGMSNAVLEAMACGLPTVATRVSGSTELVQEGRSGFLVPRNGVREAADRICQLAGDASLVKGMGKAAREIAMAAYSFERMASLHEAAYRRAAVPARRRVGRAG